MPFFKPRFTLHGDSLQLIRTTPTKLASIFDDPNILNFLSQNDSYYYNFERFQRFGQLPLSHALLRVYRKMSDILNTARGNNREDILLETLMREMVRANRDRGSTVIFLVLPDRIVYTGSGMLRFLPDLYGQTIKELRSKGFNIIDARAIFRNSGEKADELFQPDQRHYKPLANRIIAETLYPLVKKASEGKSMNREASLPHND